jgi:hypothetical protein
MRSPRKNRSIACCDIPDSRLSNFFEKRRPLCINAAAGRVFVIFARMIFNGSGVIQEADVFAFLRPSVDFLSNWNEWLNRGNGATQKQV